MLESVMHNLQGIRHNIIETEETEFQADITHIPESLITFH